MFQCFLFKGVTIAQTKTNMAKRALRILILSVYFIALFADCYMLYHGKFEKRFLCRPLLMPCLMIYLSTRKSIKTKTDTPFRIEIVLLWVALVLSWLSDILATRSTFYSLLACLSLFLLIYPLYTFMLVKLWKRMLPLDTPFKLSVLNVGVLIATFFVGAVYLKFILHIGLKFANAPLYINVLLLSVLAATVSTLATFPKMYPAIYQIVGAVLFILIANAAYAYADFAASEINIQLYVLVALGYGLSQLLMVGGVVRFFKMSQLEKEELFNKKNQELREQRNSFYSNI